MFWIKNQNWTKHLQKRRWECAIWSQRFCFQLSKIKSNCGLYWRITTSDIAIHLDPQICRLWIKHHLLLQFFVHSWNCGEVILFWNILGVFWQNALLFFSMQSFPVTFSQMLITWHDSHYKFMWLSIFWRTKWYCENCSHSTLLSGRFFSKISLIFRTTNCKCFKWYNKTTIHCSKWKHCS